MTTNAIEKPPVSETLAVSSRTSDVVTTLVLERSWLFRSYRLQYDVSAKLRPFQLSLLIDGVLTKLVAKILPEPPQGSQSDTGVIINVKGRDQGNVIDPAMSAGELPSNNELFYILGSTVHQVEDEEAPIEQRFECRVSTPFLRFTNGGLIEHSLQIDRHGSLPASVPLLRLGRAFPMRPSLFRCGFDLFSRSKLASWIGGTPVVTQSLLLEASESECRIRIVAEDLVSRDCEILSQHNLWSELAALLMVSIGFDIESDFRNRRSEERRP